jgi:hypothetical protein
MRRISKILVCLAAGASGFWAAGALGGDIFVYQSSNGSRLITDHPRMEPGYRLIKVYSESNIWNQTSRTPAPVFKPRPSAFDHLISQAAYQVNLDPLLIKSVMHAESAFNPNAVSRKGASGLMQLMPATARRYGVSSRFDPHQNVMGGARYLSFLVDKFDGDLRLALAGYNAGENAVVETGGIPPYDETRRYVKKVLGLYRQYQAEGCEQHVGADSAYSGRIISCSAMAGARATVSNVRISTPATVTSADEGGWRPMQ